MKLITSIVLTLVMGLGLRETPAMARLSDIGRIAHKLEVESRAHEIPMPVFRALLKTENRSWNPEAVAYNGKERDPNNADYGILQINARTARGYGVKDLRKLTQDIELNIEIGSAHLDGCKEQAKKRHAKISDKSERTYRVWRDALACYNAGPKNFFRAYPYADKIMADLAKDLMSEHLS